MENYSSSTVFAQTLQFDKSSCMHCGEKLFLSTATDEALADKSVEDETTDVGDLLGSENEDLRKCYSLLFEYALKYAGIEFDTDSSDKLTHALPTVSNSFCPNCRHAFRQLYKYYQIFVLSSGKKSLLKFIMKDSMIWKMRTTLISSRNSTDQKSQGRRFGKPRKARTARRARARYDDDESSQFSSEEAEVPVSYSDGDSSNADFHEDDDVACSDGSPPCDVVEEHENQDKISKITRRQSQQINLTLAASAIPTPTENGRRILRSSTRSEPRRIFKEVSSEDDTDEGDVTADEQVHESLEMPLRVKKRTNKESSARAKAEHQHILEKRKQSYHKSKVKGQAQANYLKRIQNHVKRKRKRIRPSRRVTLLPPSYAIPERASTEENSSSNHHHHQCPICYEQFSFSFVLNSHMRIVHSIRSPVKKRIRVRTLSYQCTYCSTIFNKKKLMRKHEREEHASAVAATTAAAAAAAYAALRLKQSGSGSVSQDYICDTCGKIFPTKKRLRQHTIFHEFSKNPPDTFKCGQCERGYKNPGALRAHVKFNHAPAGKANLYSICGVSFKHPSVWRRHMRTIHADGEAKPSTSSTTGEAEFPFKCEICGKGFRRKDHLGQHLRGKSHGGFPPGPPGSSSSGGRATSTTATARRRRRPKPAAVPTLGLMEDGGPSLTDNMAVSGFGGTDK